MQLVHAYRPCLTDLRQISYLSISLHFHSAGDSSDNSCYQDINVIQNYRCQLSRNVRTFTALVPAFLYCLMKWTLPDLKVEQPESAFAEGNARWTNKDLDPVPRNNRKWGVLSFIAYWISDAFNAATWQFASSIIAVGLSWRESISIVAVGFFIVSIVIAFNGATGVIYHASFPVLSRASWGFWGSYVAIISRAILAIFWFAIQTMNGANTVRVMIGAVWPSFLTLPNHIPASQGIASNTLISFVIFWLAQVPFLYMHPNNLRWLFMAKSIVVPIAWIAILIWAFRSTGGGNMFSQHVSTHGSAYSWAYLSSMTSVIGNYATLSVNQVSMFFNLIIPVLYLIHD